MARRSRQLDAEVAAALAKGSPHPSATAADWKRYIADIKERFYAATDAARRTQLNEEYMAAQRGLDALKQKAAHKPTFVTDTNLFALKSLVIDAGGPAIPNRFAAVDRPHIKRCLDAGYLEPAGQTLRLTEAGRQAVADALVKDIARESAWTPRENILVPSAQKRAELLAKDKAEHAAKVKRLEDTLAKLT